MNGKSSEAGNENDVREPDERQALNRSHNDVTSGSADEHDKGEDDDDDDNRTRFDDIIQVIKSNIKRILTFTIPSYFRHFIVM